MPAGFTSRPGSARSWTVRSPTKEALGGFYLIEGDTKEEAVAWAKKIPLRDGAFVELRPIWPM